MGRRGGGQHAAGAGHRRWRRGNLRRPALAGRRELPPPPNLLDAAAHAFDMALLASFEVDLKMLEKVNRRVREGRDASGQHVVNVRVIAPSENIPAAWILTYDPQNTDYLIRLGYEDARRMLAHDQVSAV